MAKKRTVTLINPYTKRTRTVQVQKIIAKKYNPFLLRIELPPEYFIHIVNKIGKSFKNPEECSKYHSHFRKGFKNTLFITLQNLVTKQQITTKYSSFVKKINPFNLSQDRIEVLKVQPAILKMLKKYPFKEIKKEYKISKQSKVDFLCQYEKNGKEYLLVIEAKSDNKKHNPNLINQQIKKYKEDIKNLSSNNKVILVSPKGTYGWSFKKLKRFLNKTLNKKKNIQRFF